MIALAAYFLILGTVSAAAAIHVRFPDRLVWIGLAFAGGVLFAATMGPLR